MAFIKVGNKVLKFDGKVVTNDPVPPANPADGGKTPTATPAKDISSTLTRHMLVLTTDSCTASGVNIENTGTYSQKK